MEVTLTSDLDATGKSYSEMDKKGITVASKYEQQKSKRNPYADIARKCADLTIPFEFPDTQYSGSARGQVNTPHQSVGARGVSNIANKLGLSLFPPNTSMFKLEIDDLALRLQDVDPQQKTELDSACVKVELAVNTMLETLSARAALYEAFKQLVIAGNVLLYVNPTGIRVLHLERYTVTRDPMGNVEEIIIEEEVSPKLLPKGFLSPADAKQYDKNYGKKDVKIYTCVKYKDDKCHWYQEVKGKPVPGTNGMSPRECSPFIPLRFQSMDGEDYGRSYIEQWYGDLSALDNLYQAVLEASAAMSKILFMVNPNGTTRPRALSNAENGAIIHGNAADVTVLQSQGKLNDMSLANNTIDRIEARLEFAFLFNSAVQRNAERVTAEEIRYVAESLDESLAGLYSVLTQELQLPLVRRLIYIMQRTNKIPDFPKGEDGKDLMMPKPVTGLEAVGRGDDRNKLMDFIGAATDTLGKETIEKYINMEEALRRLAASSSIDVTNLVKTPQQLQEEQQAAAKAQQEMQQQEMMSNMIASPAAGKIADNFTQPGMPYGAQIEPGGEGEQGKAALPNINNIPTAT